MDFKFNFSNQPQPDSNTPKEEEQEVNLFRGKEILADAQSISIKEYEKLTVNSTSYLKKLPPTTVELEDGQKIINSDLVAGVYEGGFKLWECAIDLLNYFHETFTEDVTYSVLEVGCGHGLPGIYFLKKNSSCKVDFQDYNPEVIENITIPNIKANFPTLEMNTRYFSGDWGLLNKFMDQNNEEYKYDLIVSTDTIYSQNSQTKLLNFIKNRMIKPNGISIIAAKKFYFGVGGGIQSFFELIETHQDLELTILRTIEDKSSNIRLIFQLKWI